MTRNSFFLIHYFAGPRFEVPHWKIKWSHFDLKSWVTGATKIRPEIPSNWRISESNRLDIVSQIANLTHNIESIFSCASDSTFRSKWLNFFFQCCWSQKILGIDSIWVPARFCCKLCTLLFNTLDQIEYRLVKITGGNVAFFMLLLSKYHLLKKLLLFSYNNLLCLIFFG